MNDLNREYLPSFESFTNTNVFLVERLKKKMIKIIIIMNKVYRIIIIIRVINTKLIIYTRQR